MQLAHDLRNLISQSVAAATPEEIARITAALCGVNQPPQAVAPTSAQVRFVLIGADGQVSNGDGKHVAVYDALNDLTWMAEPVAGGEEFEWQEAMDEARAVRLFGCDDWRAPTIQEQLSIIDYDRCDPAVDTRYFKGPYGWTWTSTEAAAPADCAWCVGLVFGLSARLHQSFHFRVRAVRAGQQFDFGFRRTG